MKSKLIFFIIILPFTLSFFSCASHITKKKEKAAAFRNLGEAYLAEGKPTPALKILLKSEKIYSKDPFLHNNLGQAYLTKGSFDLAIKHFTRAIELNPNYIPAKNNLGIAYLAKGDWDTSIKHFKEAADNILYATPTFPLCNIGWAYFNKKEYNLAEKYYRKVLALEPDFTKALWGLGRTYLKLNRASDAIYYFDKVIALSPASPLLYLDLANACELAGDTDRALITYKNLVQTSPGSPAAQIAKQKLVTLDPL